MVKQTSVLNRLESIVGAEGLMSEPAAFAVDGLTPRAAVAPAGYEQVAEVVRYAHAEGLAVIPWGGGTSMHTGNIPSRYDIALGLSRLDEVVEHEPADLTVTCQAGITLAELQRRLGQHGQQVPLGPPWDDKASVGGILAANASAPARHAYGTPRDFTIGMRVVTADGRITRAGGRVVKNVAGYDLCKLYIGSFGTLGVIVEASFKLAPLPRAGRTVIVSFDSAVTACEFASELKRRRLALRSVELLNASAAQLPGPAPWTLVLALAGTPHAVERTHREARELARGAVHLHDTDDQPWAGAGGASSTDTVLLCKASALPTQMPVLLDAMGDLGSPRIAAMPTVGVLYTSWPALDDVEDTIARLRQAVRGLGGSLVVERCPLDLKRQLDVFGDVSGPAFELMRRLKERFDPKGILSPGRFIGGL